MSKRQRQDPLKALVNARKAKDREGLPDPKTLKGKAAALPPSRTNVLSVEEITDKKNDAFKKRKEEIDAFKDEKNRKHLERVADDFFKPKRAKHSVEDTTEKWVPELVAEKDRGYREINVSGTGLLGNSIAANHNGGEHEDLIRDLYVPKARQEIIEELRKYKLPKTFFGESDESRAERLLEHKRSLIRVGHWEFKGQGVTNVFEARLQKVAKAEERAEVEAAFEVIGGSADSALDTATGSATTDIPNPFEGPSAEDDVVIVGSALNPGEYGPLPQLIIESAVSSQKSGKKSNNPADLDLSKPSNANSFQNNEATRKKELARPQVGSTAHVVLADPALLSDDDCEIDETSFNSKHYRKVRAWVKKQLKVWRNELAQRPREEQYSEFGKHQTATFQEGLQDVQGLLDKLKNQHSENQAELDHYVAIVDYCEERFYRKAGEHFLNLVRGHSLYTYGVPRWYKFPRGGSRIYWDYHDPKQYVKNLYHENLRKGLQVFKRLISKAQKHNPTEDPSKWWQQAQDQFREDGVYLGTQKGLGSYGGTALSGTCWDKIRNQEYGNIGGEGALAGEFQ